MLELVRRAVVALERLVQRIDLLTFAQYNYTTQTVDIAAEGLKPGWVPRQRFDVTVNSADPLDVQLSVRDDGAAKYLDVFIFDAYGSIVYMAHLRAKTLKELQAAQGF